jgi:hypothetical protein
MDPNRIPATGESAPAVVDVFVVLGALVAMAVLIFFWAVAIRKPGRRRRKHRHRHRRKSIPAVSPPRSPSAPTGSRQPSDNSKKPPLPPALRK